MHAGSMEGNGTALALPHQQFLKVHVSVLQLGHNTAIDPL